MIVIKEKVPDKVAQQAYDLKNEVIDLINKCIKLNKYGKELSELIPDSLLEELDSRLYKIEMRVLGLIWHYRWLLLLTEVHKIDAYISVLYTYKHRNDAHNKMTEEIKVNLIQPLT